MKIRISPWGLALWCALAVTARGETYFVEALMTELPVSALEDFMWTVTGKRVAHVSTITDDGAVIGFRRDHPEFFSVFPVLKVTPGIPAEIDLQDPVRYASEVDLEGNPTKHEERGVGKRISADILEVKERGVLVKIFLEEAALVGWMNYRMEEIGIDIPQPIFSSRNVNTTLDVFFDQWVMMGGLVREREQDENLHQLILFTVRQEHPPPSPPAE